MTGLLRKIIVLPILLLPYTSFALEIELTADAPAQVLTLPKGLTADQTRIEVIRAEYEEDAAGPIAPIRRFALKGYTIEAQAPIEDVVSVRSGRLFGEEVLYLRSAGRTLDGTVRSVTVRIGSDQKSETRLPAGWNPIRPKPTPVLVIITTARIVSRSGFLAPYVRWREAQGLKVIVADESEWDVDVSSGRPERIRAYLSHVKASHGLGYVLLIGDPNPGLRNGVPMKLTHPLSEVIAYLPEVLQDALDPVPTDHYYADLTGNWDVDRDGRYGEYPDDAGSTGVKWEPDALVGRIPIYGNDIPRLDRILHAIMQYESDPSPGYRHRVLLPATYIGFVGQDAPGGGIYEETNDGAVNAEAVYNILHQLDPDAEPIRLYEDAGSIPSSYDHELSLSEANLVAEWDRGAGIVAAYAHGSPDGDWRTAWLGDWNENSVPDWGELLSDPFLMSRDAEMLHNAPPAFTFHAACENGWPEADDNLASSLLGAGAIGTVGASRAAIGSSADFEPDPRFGDADTLAFTFVHLLLEGYSAGEAMAFLRYGLPADGWGDEYDIDMNGYGWLGKMEYNLYGDPLVSMGVCDNADDCDDGSLCNGTSSCVDGFCVRGSAVDCSSLDDVCVMGQCERATGECQTIPRPAGIPCDDGLYCTVEDACLEGTCQAKERSCGTPPDGFVAACIEEQTTCVMKPEPKEPEPMAKEEASVLAINPEDSGNCGCRASRVRPTSLFMLLRR